MYTRADNIPGQPHPWAPAIAAWAFGRLVQWRYKSPEANDLDWRDCDYPSRGRPNFENPDIEFRVAPTPTKCPGPSCQGCRECDWSTYV